MSKWRGKIGFGLPMEIEPGIYENRIVEKTFRGDILKNTQNNQNSGNINDNLVLSNKLKIVASPFVQVNLSRILYIEWFGAKWKVTSVTPEYPHVILDIGDVYNGQTA